MIRFASKAIKFNNMIRFAPKTIKFNGLNFYFDVCERTKDAILLHKKERKKKGWLVRVKPFGCPPALPFAYCLYKRKRRKKKNYDKKAAG